MKLEKEKVDWPVLEGCAGFARESSHWFCSKIVPTDSFTAELWRLRERLKLVKDKGLCDVGMELDLEVVVKAIQPYGSMENQEKGLSSFHSITRVYEAD